MKKKVSILIGGVILAVVMMLNLQLYSSEDHSDELRLKDIKAFAGTTSEKCLLYPGANDGYIRCATCLETDDLYSNGNCTF